MYIYFLTLFVEIVIQHMDIAILMNAAFFRDPYERKIMICLIIYLGEMSTLIISRLRIEAQPKSYHC